MQTLAEVAGKDTESAVDPILSPEATGIQINRSVSTLARWRANGEGPEWIPVGPRGVGYRQSAVDAYLLNGHGRKNEAAA
ncbi:MAG TPA: hypothetical protein VGG61_09045 [Gemmataceae bacterium]|jgi:predicted DNA-binding transcriptional regulator AlpA